MGCDIHFYVEKPGANGWEYVPAPKGLDDFADRYGYPAKFYRGRDYTLFSWLAGVRDDGTMGAMAEPRGLPADISSFVHQENTLRIVSTDNEADEDSEGGSCTLAQATAWNSAVKDGRASHPDWHSHSWFTVKELMAGLENVSEKHHGLVSLISYAQWKAKGTPCPNCWCGWASGKSMKEAEFLELGDEFGFASKAQMPDYIECEWTVGSEHTFEQFKKSLADIIEHAGPDARVVFWFDN